MQFGDFRLASGKQSPYKLELAHAQSDSSIMVMLEREYADLVNAAKPDILSPVPSTSVPIGPPVARQLGLPMITVRIKEQDEIGEYIVDGFTKFAKGKNAVILDDVATTDGSIIKAAETLRRRGKAFIRIMS